MAGHEGFWGREAPYPGKEEMMAINEEPLDQLIAGYRNLKTLSASMV
jgi:hypothetical protein